MARDPFLNPKNPDALTDPADKPTQYGDQTEPKRGKLLEWAEGDPEEQKKAAKTAAKLFFDRGKLYTREKAEWEVAEARMDNMTGVGIRRSEDDVWSSWISPVASPDDIPGPNQMARLCRRMNSILYADPAVPKPSPTSGDDEDAELAELLGRVLKDIDSESYLNELQNNRNAADMASTYGSGFQHYFVNPRGGGLKPIVQEAHPNAARIEDALDFPAMDPVLGPPIADPMTGMEMPGEPMMDPMTGQPQMQPRLDPATGEQVREPWPEEELTERYIDIDGNLIDEPGHPKVAKRWEPRLEQECLTSHQVRPLPWNAQDIWECTGVQIAGFITWGEVKEKWPKFAAYDEADNELRAKRDALFKYRPAKGVDDLASLLSQSDDPNRLNSEPEDVDDRLVLSLRTYFKAGEEYAEGMDLTTLGETEVAQVDTWIWEKEDGTTETLEIPVTQHKQFRNGRRNFYGTGLATILGSTNEAKFAVWDSFLAYMERMDHQLIALPMGSTLRPEHLRLPYGTAVSVPAGGEPKEVPIGPYPQAGFQFWEMFTNEMNSDSTLEQAAQGVEDPSVQSGYHAQTILSQVQAGMSELVQNEQRAQKRGWRIKAQLLGAYFDVPQKVKWAGDDKEFQVETWIGADFSTTRDIEIEPGSFTQLSPAAKANLSRALLADGVIDPWRHKKITRQQLGGQLGLEEDEPWVRIRRQIASWKDGPSSALEANPPQQVQVPAVDPMSGMPLPPGPMGEMPNDPMTGQPVMQWPMIPELAAIWEPVLADTLPDIAQTRLREIADLMCTKGYLRQPVWWRTAVDQEFQKMQQAVAMGMGGGQPMRAPEEQKQQEEPGGPPKPGDGNKRPAPGTGEPPGQGEKEQAA